MMVQNFMDEFNSLQDQRIMGIYGSAHTALGSMNYAGIISNMATQLQAVYGQAIESVDLRATPLSVTSDVLPYHNYPVPATQGQVFVINYTLQDGSVQRMLYRADGQVWKGTPVTRQFLAE